MNFLKRIDFVIILPVIALAGISLAIIASTTPLLFTQQLIFSLIGLFLYIVFSSIDFRIWPKFIWIFYAFSLVLLFVTFFGREIRGSSRWIDLGWFRLQPSEMIKPFFVLFIAQLFAGAKGKSLTLIVKPFIFFLPILLLIFKQPDLGNVLVYGFIFILITLVSEIPLFSLLTSFGILALFLPVSWHALEKYQKSRLLSFLDPGADPTGTGYNALQAIIAIGSGRLAGLGLGHGTQSHLLFLPEYHTDFIFAAIGEELGFLAGFLVIFFYFVLLMKILYIAAKQENKFTRFVTVGIFAQIFIQVFINIGMNLGISPITGITLPFLSYGGSSIISTFIGLGLVSNIAKSARFHNPIEIK